MKKCYKLRRSRIW